MPKGLIKLWLLIPALLLLVGCGARVEQTITFLPDGSGRIEVVARDEVSDITEYAKGVDQVKAVLSERLPPGWELNVTTAGGDAVFRMSTAFQSPADLQERMRQALGDQATVTWQSQRTPFTKRDELKGVPLSNVWAAWGVKAVQSLTTQDVIEQVVSYVEWPGQQRQPLGAATVHEAHRGVDQVSLEVHLTPDGPAYTAEIRPGQGDLYQPVDEWLRQIPGATVTAAGDAFRVSVAAAQVPWAGRVTSSTTRHNLFWNKTVVRQEGLSLKPWLGEGVTVGQVSYTYGGPGWIAPTDLGPPKWYTWPRHTQAPTGLTWKNAGETIQLVSYTPRPALYVAWGIGALLLLALVAMLPFAVKNRARVIAALRKGVGQMPGSSGSFADLANAAWHRLYQVGSLQPVTVEPPLMSGLLSLAVRAIALAFLLDRVLRSFLGNVGRAIARSSFGLLGGDMLPALGWKVFGWSLLALVLATAICLAIYYVPLGAQNLPRVAAALADAQWPVVIAFLAAWVTGSIWAPLAGLCLVIGVAWGQSLLIRGLGALASSYRQKLSLHLATTAVTMAVPILMVTIAINRAMN